MMATNDTRTKHFGDRVRLSETGHLDEIALSPLRGMTNRGLRRKSVADELSSIFYWRICPAVA